jgi:hypothetical protein
LITAENALFTVQITGLEKQSTRYVYSLSMVNYASRFHENDVLSGNFLLITFAKHPEFPSDRDSFQIIFGVNA